ncbi:hypothetical protein RUM44_006168 [Polyplax serrata]|uniref:Uncharacterized protein n=1 Tax=Polyplax serrata TaxID=468196 RepID=A0ABR1AZ70_POLSC
MVDWSSRFVNRPGEIGENGCNGVGLPVRRTRGGGDSLGNGGPLMVCPFPDIDLCTLAQEETDKEEDKKEEKV